MLEFKFDVYKELSKIGMNTSKAKTTGIFSQSTMQKLKNGDTSISLENLNRICCLLEMQPRDIIKYVETEKDREEILTNFREK